MRFPPNPNHPWLLWLLALPGGIFKGIFFRNCRRKRRSFFKPKMGKAWEGGSWVNPTGAAAVMMMMMMMMGWPWGVVG